MTRVSIVAILLGLFPACAGDPPPQPTIDVGDLSRVRVQVTLQITVLATGAVGEVNLLTCRTRKSPRKPFKPQFREYCQRYEADARQQVYTRQWEPTIIDDKPIDNVRVVTVDLD